MGLFGNLFEKKNCSICGGEIGLLGNRKLEDGNLCKSCAAKLSPFFSDRRSSTVEEIREQLAYREANKDAVSSFNVTRTLGGPTKVLVDEDNGKFCVTSARNWRDTNPDIMDLSQVTGCTSRVDETRTELKREKPDGTSESYNPPRYDIDYDIVVTIDVNTPYFSSIGFRVNADRIEQQGSAEFRQYMEQANEICSVLSKAREGIREAKVAAAAPKAAVTCPHCGASTIPDASGRCEYCGGAVLS